MLLVQFPLQNNEKEIKKNVLAVNVYQKGDLDRFSERSNSILPLKLFSPISSHLVLFDQTG